MDGNYEGAHHTYIYSTLENIKNPIITETYSLPYQIKKKIRAAPNPFSSAYAECVFLRTYSRKKEDGTKETWGDTVIRVMEGLCCAYLTHYRRNGLTVDMPWLNKFASDMTWSFFNLQWSPPGRGLWAMGTEHTRANGNASLNNCYACATVDLVKAASFCFDMLACGGGVGYDCSFNSKVIMPNKTDNFIFKCPDTRQGWACCIELLLRAYIPIDGVLTNKFPIFDLSLVRPYGEPIKGFGGKASGPEPLKKVLKEIEIFLDTYIAWQQDQSFFVFRDMVERLYSIGSYQGSSLKDEVDKLQAAWKTGKKTYGKSRLVVDIMNVIGKAVIAGNVRRSATIAISDAGDEEFLILKEYSINPERSAWSWMSNNSIRMESDEDFSNTIPEIAKRVQNGGEPGGINMKTLKHARLGDKSYGEDTANLMNPCGEISLNSFEPCCLSTLCPVKCIDSNGIIDENTVLAAARYACFYASTVTLIRHHWPESNAIVAKNRRIGVSLTGIAELVDNPKYGYTYLNNMCRKVYNELRSFNNQFAEKSGVPRSIKVSTIKPEGSLSVIMETSAGMHWPICRYCKRRIALSKDSELIEPLKNAGYQIEESTLDSNTVYAIFPLSSNGARPEREISLFEQFGLAASLQKHYSDNSCSFTGHFSKERESSIVDKCMSMFAPMMKSWSVMPYSDDTNQKTIYKHLPFEEVSEEEYQELLKKIKPVQWSKISSDAVVEKGCNTDTCS